MPAESEKHSFLAHLRADRRFPAMVGLGFSSGIPYLLIYVTQSAWLSEAKAPIEIIGMLSELTLAYKFKFLWAPFLDQYDAPLLGRLLGRRRGWIVASQIGVALSLAGIAFGDPASWLAWTIIASFALGFAGATQDVTIDGWRINAAPEGKQALMNSFSEMGWRVGTLCSGAGALILADRYGWRASYLAMAALISVGAVSCLFAPEPEPPADAPLAQERKSFIDSVLAPAQEMMFRLGPIAIPILVMIAGFRMPGYISNAMAMPLFEALHYSKTDIATVTKLFGFWVAIGGTLLSGFLVPRIGMMPSLLLGTISASASHLALAYLAAHGGEFWVFATAVSIDGFAGAFATIVLITYMSSLTSSALAASQYALMTSLCALPGSLLAGSSGFLVKHLGFEHFFIATSLIGVPVALLCLALWREETRRMRSYEATELRVDGHA